MAVAVGSVLAGGMSNLSARYPVGLPRPAESGTALSMGGAATGTLNDIHVLLANPANLGGIDKTAFSALLAFDFVRISQMSQQSNHVSVAPRQISFAFPLGLAGTVALSLSKETDADVKFQTDSSLIPNSDNLYGRLSYRSKGGTTGWQFGWGRRIGKWAYVGAAYERMYFELNNTKIVDLTNYPATSTRDSTRIHFAGHAIRLGLMVPVAKATIGLAGRYVFEDDLRYSRGQYRLDESVPISGSGSSSIAQVKLPPYLVAGASYEFSPRWLAAGDLNIIR